MHTAHEKGIVCIQCVWGDSPSVLICILGWVNHNMRVGAAPGAELRPPTQCALEADIPLLPTKAASFFSKRTGKCLELC